MRKPAEQTPSTEALAEDIHELAYLLGLTHRVLPRLLGRLRRGIPEAQALAHAWSALEHALHIVPPPPGPLQLALAATPQGWHLVVLDGTMLSAAVSWKDLSQAVGRECRGEDPHAIASWLDEHPEVQDIGTDIGARTEDLIDAIRAAVNEVRSGVIWGA